MHQLLNSFYEHIDADQAYPPTDKSLVHVNPFMIIAIVHVREIGRRSFSMALGEGR